MLNNRVSILTLESEGQIIAELRVFGWQCAVEGAISLKKQYGFNPDDPVCFIYIESEMNFLKEKK